METGDKEYRSFEIVTPGKKSKTLSDLYGIFEGKMDMSLEDIKKYEYSYEDKV